MQPTHSESKSKYTFDLRDFKKVQTLKLSQYRTKLTPTHDLNTVSSYVL